MKQLHSIRHYAFYVFLASIAAAIASTPSTRLLGVTRGGGDGSSTTTKVVRSSSSADAYELLADFVNGQLDDLPYEKIVKGLSSLELAQQAFKGLDGFAHEAYQRTHSGDDIDDTSVTGRAQRSAARLAATAEALLACELVEIVEKKPDLADDDDEFLSRQVLVNITVDDENAISIGDNKLSVLVFYEKDYDRGAGLDHGTITSLTESQRNKPQGRLIVVVSDGLADDMVGTLEVLNKKPLRVKLSSGLVRDEVVSVQPILYKAAAKLLTTIEPTLRKYNTTAVHFVGRSLAGGVASLAATMLDGTLPMPKSKKGRGKRGSMSHQDEDVEETTNEGNATNVEEQRLSGLGKARSSALSLGAPPCLSSNVLAAFCTSILYGDDVICRASQESIECLCDRVRKKVNGGFVNRNLGWISDTVSLTVTNLNSHAHGSEGEEVRLAIPGRAYLIRPRRFHSICSIHEVGNMKKGGREALRAQLLWQLNDVLLSKSMWRHHDLNSYIRGLDRVQLRGTSGGEEAMF